MVAWRVGEANGGARAVRGSPTPHSSPTEGLLLVVRRRGGDLRSEGRRGPETRAEPKAVGRGNGPGRQGVLLLPRDPAEAAQLHPRGAAARRQPAFAVRRGGDRVRLVRPVP